MSFSAHLKTTAAIAAALPLALLLPCCRPPALGPGMQDFSATLLGTYTLNRTSSHNVYISSHGGLDPDSPRIPSKVLECAVHPPFILGKRQGLKPRAPADPYQIPDPEVIDFWILDTRGTGTALGPLTLEAFTLRRRELHIPDSVALRDVYSYRSF